jgi:hypothetical protein
MVDAGFLSILGGIVGTGAAAQNAFAGTSPN